MSKLSLVILLCLWVLGKCGGDSDDSERTEINCVNTGSNFRYKVIQADKGPLIIFGDMDDTTSAVFCLEFDRLVEVNDYDQSNCDWDGISSTRIDFKDLEFTYTNSSDCQTFQLATSTTDGVNITLDFEVEVVDETDPALKYTFTLDNYIFNENMEATGVNSSLLLFLVPKKCDNLYNIRRKESLDSNDTDTSRRRRRRLRKRGGSDSKDRGTGVSSDDSDDFDLNSLVFRNTPNATATCGGSEEVIDVGMCYDGNFIVLAFEEFGLPNLTCSVVQDPYALIDVSKYNSTSSPESKANIVPIAFVYGIILLVSLLI